MHIEISRKGRTEFVAIERLDGSRAGFSIPSKGPVSHDIVHFCVESVLGMRTGFWGSVAAGEEPGAIQDRAKAAGHASAKRAERPQPEVVELLQAERLVECFEAESWAGGADDDGLRAMANAGWDASFVPRLDLRAGDLADVRAMLAELGGRWQALPEGEALVLEWAG